MISMNLKYGMLIFEDSDSASPQIKIPDISVGIENIEVFNDGTSFNKIEKILCNQTEVLTFDIKTMTAMKTTALLCRSMYDARDLVDLFFLLKNSDATLSFPTRDCEVINNYYNERLQDIKSTSKEDLYYFQTIKQVEDLPYEEFEKLKRSTYDWLSRFC